jgi:hypothetical protein
MNFFVRHCADRAAGDPLANRCARRSDDTNVANLRRNLLPLNKLRFLAGGASDKYADM